MVVPVPTSCDVAIVGAGIIGLAVARETLRRDPGARVVVLEQEATVASHQTGHNSGVLHAGVYYRPGSLKARLCRDGAEAMVEFCAQHDIPVDVCGKLIIARDANETPALQALEDRARANGVPGLRRVGAGGIAEMEPHARGVAALHVACTAVVDFGLVARALADEVTKLGGIVLTGARVQGVRQDGHHVTLRLPDHELRARFLIGCAGAWSDRLARLAGAAGDLRIVPFRGAYLRLRPERGNLVRALIYPVPDPRLPFLGVHLTRHVDGDVTIGPSALPVLSRTAYRLREVRARDARDSLMWPGTWRMAARWWRMGATEIARAASRARFVAAAREYVPDLRVDDLQPHGTAGVRAQAVARDGTLIDDFVFARGERSLHVCNAPSPAATAALAIARHVVDEAARARR